MKTNKQKHRQPYRIRTNCHRQQNLPNCDKGQFAWFKSSSSLRLCDACVHAWGGTHCSRAQSGHNFSPKFSWLSTSRINSFILSAYTLHRRWTCHQAFSATHSWCHKFDHVNFKIRGARDYRIFKGRVQRGKKKVHPHLWSQLRWLVCIWHAYTCTWHTKQNNFVYLTYK